MRSCRFTPFRLLVSLSLLVFYAHAMRLEPLPPHEREAINPVFEFEATAYCIRGITASGEPTRPGTVAADPKVLPLGSIIEIETPEHTGVYRVTDVGPNIRGKRLDIFIRNWHRAVEFGRQKVLVKVLQYGTLEEPDHPER